ncbi:MAG: hypothetical protein ACRDQF_14420 [Thermocrispum sp.]
MNRRKNPVISARRTPHLRSGSAATWRGRRCVVTGKRCFPDQQCAEDALGWIWSAPRPGRRLECRAYHCTRCDQWHLTSMPLAMGA